MGTWRARERARREGELTLLALAIAEERGTHALTLATLADESDYSKGTIYNHFATVEDLWLELSSESARRQLRYYQEILGWDEPAQTKFFALALAYLHHAAVQPVLFELSLTAKTAAVVRRADAVRIEQRGQLEGELIRVVGGVAREYAEQGGYAGGATPWQITIDLIRTWLLGHATTALFDEPFHWAVQPSPAVYALTRVTAGLGWRTPSVEDLAVLERRALEVVERVNEVIARRFAERDD